MSDPSLAYSSFSTEHLSSADGIKAWQQYLAEVYCRQDVQLEDSDYVSGIIKKRSIGEMIASRFSSGAKQRVIRTNELAKFDRIEHFQFVFPLAGQFSYQQGDVSRCSGKDGAFILNASRSFRIDFSVDAESVVLALPCDVVRRRIIGIDDFVARSAISDPLLIHSISNMALDLVEIESHVEGFKLQEACIDLLDLAVADARSRYTGLLESDLLGDLLVERILTVIQRKFVDPRFHVSDLAQLCRVSTRQIQKVLSKRKTTFSRELLNMRLAKASHLLKARSRSTATIGQVAAQCGFTSPSHFSNCYRHRFGVTPREDQQGHRG